MFKAIKEFFFGKQLPVEEAPYKIETPSFDDGVKLGPEKVEEKPAPTKKKPISKKRQFDKKPAAKKTSAKSSGKKKSEPTK